MGLRPRNQGGHKKHQYQTIHWSGRRGSERWRCAACPLARRHSPWWLALNATCNFKLHFAIICCNVNS
jgi:hypothetical protein